MSSMHPGPMPVNEPAHSAASPAPIFGPEDHTPAQLARNIRAFSLWDWGTSAFSSVILTFVFATYITSGVATAGITDPAARDTATDAAAATLSSTQAWAAVAIAILAPLLGTYADTGGRRNLFLRIFTFATAGIVALMVFVKPEPSYVLLGSVLIALAVVTSELALVFVNSVLPQISTPHNRGRISGTAWALGYWGSILCLVIVLFGFVMPDGGLLGITEQDAWNLRAIPLFVAAWIALFCAPVLWNLPPSPRDPSAPPSNPWRGYQQIITRILRAWRHERTIFHFLIASAIYRDGLGAVFSLAGVIAAGAYGFSTQEIIFFGIAANLIAGIGVFIGGKIDDRIGSRPVILTSIVAVIACGLVIYVFSTSLVFWIAGLMLCFFVGPINASSRNLLTHLSDPARYTENFGLYAMSGRAFGFLGTGAFSIAVVMGGTRAGILGITLVLALGLALFIPLKLREHTHGRAALT